MIDNPAHGLEGGDVAAPLFHHIAAYELSAAKIPPTGSQSVLVPLHPDPDRHAAPRERRHRAGQRR